MRVSSEDNTSDIYTKNTDVTTFKYYDIEIDLGFLRLRQKVFDSNESDKLENQRLLGGMSSESKLKSVVYKKHRTNEKD